MKPDTERKKYYKAKMHRKRNNLHVHLSKDLRTKLKRKKRSVLLRRDDTVRVMRGPEKGKEGRVSSVDTSGRKVYVEGLTVRNAKAKEVLIPLQPSNLLLIGLEPTKERRELFSEDAFKKPKTEKKPEKKKEEKKAEAEKPAEEKPKAPEAPAPKG